MMKERGIITSFIKHLGHVIRAKNMEIFNTTTLIYQFPSSIMQSELGHMIAATDIIDLFE